MPTARVNGVDLFYEEVGEGVPLVFVHEFAGEARSWHLQVRFFARRYRTIAYNARGYPPSDVPDDPKAYSQDQAADDIRGLLDALGIRKAHICGLSMGGYATLHFGLRYAERALSLVVAGAAPPLPAAICSRAAAANAPGSAAPFAASSSSCGSIRSRSSQRRSSA